MNELAMMFDRFSLDTNEILNAASTKWNFLKFKPGLVGGHCIGVDPYYLTYIAKRNNHIPKLILNGRSLNDNMYKYVSQRIFEYLKKKYDSFDKLDVLLLGLTFKENCNDIRNSQSIKLYNHLKKKIKNLYAYEPYLNLEEKSKSIKNVLTLKKLNKKFDLVILSVSHQEFKFLNKNKDILKDNKSFIFDIKWFLKPHPKVINL